MHFCIFSFNRGPFLHHCIESINTCAPQCKISIYDDGSDDPLTCEILAQLTHRIEVINCQDTDGLESKHGGLYRNMQRALDDRDSGSIFCFLQDDMQLTRALDDAELARMHELLADVDQARLIQPAFLKGCNRHQDQASGRFDSQTDGYFHDRFENSAGAHYSDICIASTDHLRKIKWQFQPRESRNEEQARQKLKQMLYLRNPFTAWLPSVPAWRGRTRTLGLRLAHRLDHSGFHPFNIMSEKERGQFLNRDSGDLPVAEDFLTLTSGELPTPWHYHPLQDHRFLKILDSVERRLFSH